MQNLRCRHGQRDVPSNDAGLASKCRSDLLHPPDWTTLVQRPFLANEGRRSATLQPYVVIGGLLPDQRSNHPRNAAQFDMQRKSVAFRFNPPTLKGRLPVGLIEI